MIPETLAGRARYLAGQLRCTRSEALALAVLAAGALAALGLLWALAGSSEPWTRSEPASPGQPDPAGTPGAAPLQISGADVVVHVAGLVEEPGVYRLPAGSRVGDAIAAAGGPGDDAALDALNLARPLADGEQVRVGSVVVAGDGGAAGAAGAAAGGAAGAAGEGTPQGARRPDGTLDLNLASAAELEELPGIGPVMAGRIVEHREEHGPFTALGDLRQVRGIGEKTFQSLVDLLSL